MGQTGSVKFQGCWASLSPVLFAALIESRVNKLATIRALFDRADREVAAKMLEQLLADQGDEVKRHAAVGLGLVCLEQ
jgi:uncharacterized protein (DUF2336 family)